MVDYEWRKPLPAGSNVFKGIRIYYQDGTEAMIQPTEGQHVLLMTWLEIEKTQSQEPGMILYHSDTETIARMFDRFFRKYMDVWYNLQKLWAMREAHAEVVDRFKRKFSGKSRAVN